MKKILLIALLAISAHTYAHTYEDSIYKHRQEYKKEFLTDPKSPLKAADTSFLVFFKPNPAYRVNAVFSATPDSKPFEMATHSGKNKTYRIYGTLSFKLFNRPYKLQVYQSAELSKNPVYKDYLFIPFNDLTNYQETYGGGRYLDITTGDIKNNQVVLDFNKCYNPYCAYGDGYSCPIPPAENKLDFPVKAGEKNFARKTQD